jgi:hypothetical protein
MNAIESLKIIQTRNIAYPRASTNQGKESLQEEAMLYADLFQNESFVEVDKALKKHMEKSSYPPAISDIKNELAWTKNLKPIDAWSKVEKVIGEYGIYRANEALEHLEGNVLEAVKRVGFSKLCRMSEAEAKETFIEAYKELALSNQGGIAC